MVDRGESPYRETVVRDARFPHSRKALEQSRPIITVSRREEKTYTRRLDNSGNIEEGFFIFPVPEGRMTQG